MSEPEYLTNTRNGYDAIAESSAEMFRSEFDGAPLDRAMLAGFAETVRRDHPDPRAVDVGSGHGVVTSFLAAQGLAVSGIDLSAGMVEYASRTYPDLDFAVGEMGRLPVPDAGVAAVVAWYSLIHVPAAERPAVVAEFRRVLRPGGYLLLAFQVGTDTRHLDEAFGRDIALDFHRLDPDDVASLLEVCGFEVFARLVRLPEPGSATAPVPQAFLIGRTPVPAPSTEPPPATARS
ncbi:class I SAM-dependent methyltransferase [Pseudonocardia nematodicida]|uniref:Class I SAM-dependent methyltransferase n=1 Tax=Pseudonocardia nematodicida TaxID=1206997 RepID=A0ABV1KHI6_9PSEU